MKKASTISILEIVQVEGKRQDLSFKTLMQLLLLAIALIPSKRPILEF
jgi:hypothetical protein